MEFKQSNIEEILASEHEMALRGQERFGDYFINASEFNGLLQEFIKSIDPDRFIFAIFLSQIRKHYTLALFSTLRLHHTQAMMDIRQVLEAGSCAGYAIVNPDVAGFADIGEDGLLDATQELTKKRYAWIQEKFPDASNAIKNAKDGINKSSAHSNIIYAHNNFRFDSDQYRFETPFFDIEDEYLIKTDLWQIGNIVMGLMDFFYGVNKDLNVIKFIDDFLPRLKKCEVANHKLKAELMATERYKKAKRIVI